MMTSPLAMATMIRPVTQTSTAIEQEIAVMILTATPLLNRLLHVIVGIASSGVATERQDTAMSTGHEGGQTHALHVHKWIKHDAEDAHKAARGSRQQP